MPSPLRRRSFLVGLGAVMVAGCDTGTPSREQTPAHPGPTASSRPTPAASTAPTLASLRTSLNGKLLQPQTAGYAVAAKLFNPRFDSTSRPAAIARCADADDVALCIRYAAATGSPFALRSGGHSYGGWSTSSGLVIDVRALDSVTVDRAAMTARIGAGANLAHVYSALAAQGVALAAGSCPTVGIAGLTLGGGVGVLTRAYGLTCDALTAVEIVTADGSLRAVDRDHDAALFWALRGGGGGSFGAVTALTFTVKPAPAVSLFYYRWDLTHGEAVLEAWQHLLAKAPDELWSSAKLLADPGSGSGGANVIVAGTWIGSPGALQAQLDPLLAEVGAAPADTSISTLGYLQAMLAEGECGTKTAQQCAAAALTPAERLPFSATSSFLPKPLPAQGVAAAVAVARTALEVPDLLEGGMSFDALGGAVAATRSSETAFAHRAAFATVQFSATWSGSRATGPFDGYARSARSALLPFTGDTAYVNYADPSLTDHTSAYWAGNYPALQEVKRAYDPGSLFTFAQAVRP